MARKKDIYVEDVMRDPSLISPTPLTHNPIDAWSWSRLQTYEQCPLKFKLQNIDKIKTPAGPAMARGRKVHDDAADFLLGKRDDIPPEMESRRDTLVALKQMEPFVEQKWAADNKWKPTGYFKKGAGGTWFRYSLDAGVDYGNRTFEAIDWKTGKKYGYSEDQLELFGLGVLTRFPEMERVKTRLAYVDLPPGPDSEVYGEVLAKDKEALKAKWESRAMPMFKDTIFAPRQNSKCYFCDFARGNGGPCRYG